MNDEISLCHAGILVVDDNPANLSLLTEMLAKQGYKVRIAPSGKLALHSAQANPPDLVLLDIMMPGMDGFEVCTQLKNEAHTREIPIIFLSAMADTKSKLQAFEAGGVDYVTKPFEEVEVLARVENHLRLRALQACVEEKNRDLTEEIRERRQAQAALEESNQKLILSNRELQNFAYAVSHDLQEPLRMVSSYVGLLARRYHDKLDQDAHEFIAFASGGVKRMGAMIDAVLEYSRVETQGETFRGTDMEQALAEALANLQFTIEEKAAQITHTPLPRVIADPPQMTRLLQNLIGNALKFHGPETPRIRMEAVRQGEQWMFSVRDNGIGIAPSEQERIFTVFQRLHTQEEYPGIGIGLSICKRIVTRHGGRIWVEAEPGAGSVFYFSLPAAS